MANIVPALTFVELLIVIGVIAVLVVGILFFLSKKGFSIKRKDTTFIIGEHGERIEVDKNKAHNLMMFLDVLNIKDNINKISFLVLERQKKFAKEKITEFKDRIVQIFKELMIKRIGSEVDVISSTDFLYFTLLMEKVYYLSMTKVMNDIEENGLANKQDYERYASERTDVILSSIDTLVNSMYSGISSKMPKALYDRIRSQLDQYMRTTFKEIYRMALKVSKKGQEKKEEYKSYLFEKVKLIEGISETQFMTMFSSVKSEDFLDI